MNRIEDERIRFFFKHEARIREWMRLEAQVHKFVHRFYRSLQRDLDAPLRDGRINDKGVESFYSRSDYPKVGLRRQEWLGRGKTPSVAMEWHRKKALFPPRGYLCFGVQWTGKVESWPFDRKDHPDFPKKGVYWPAFTSSKQAPKHGFWEGDKLKHYRKTLVKTMLTAWKELAPLVDKAIGDPRT